MMTKRHFEAFAREIAGLTLPTQLTREQALMVVALVVIRVANENNPRFDRERFLKACNLIPRTED